MKKIPIAPLNIVYVQLDKRVNDTKRFASGIVLYKDTTFHPEEASNIEAKVVSIPRGIQGRHDYYGMSAGGIEPGDTILIRYDVVFRYFNQPERDTPIFKNLVAYKGEEYWKVDVQQIFGVLRKGTVEMLNGYVMCDPISEKVNLGSFAAPEHWSTKESNEQYKIRYISSPLNGEPNLGIERGDIVHTRPGVAQHYETDWGEFCIIKQSHILGKSLNMS